MSSDSLLGAVVDGRYVITERLAHGGMATVYRARDKRLERDVALKLMHPHIAENAEFTERFNREARAAARLSSAFVVTVHDQGVWDAGDGRQAYLVMEYVPGPDLRSELARLGSFNLGTALTIVEQTLRALSAAHSAGIVHRDVKPENIMLASMLPSEAVFERSDINAKVADFGLARAATSAASSSGQVMGTVAYLAPEIITTGVADAPADVYAVGIMLYEFLTGSLPFQADTPISTAYMHINDPVPLVGEKADWLPESIDPFIGLLTAKDASQRPANGEVALRELLKVTRAIAQDDLLRRIPVTPPSAEDHHDDGTPSAAEAANATIPMLRPPQEATQPYIPVAPAEASAAGTSTQPYVPTIPALATAGSAAVASASAHSPAVHSAAADPPGPSAGPGPDAPARHDTTVLARRRPSRRILAAVLALLLLAAAATGVWYFRAGPGMRTEVPNVAGQTYDQASAKLEQSGLKATRQEAYSDTVPAGSVISTKPRAGQRIHPSKAVSVTVSLGVEQVVVPGVVGATGDDARRTLESSRLTVKTTEEYSDSVGEGVVISQSVEPNTKVDHHTEVTISVSKGREPATVPDVVGKKESAATSAIEKAGLKVERKEEYSDSVDEGVVISQTPEQGSAYKNDTVTITVSRGPEQVEVPWVVGLSRSEARSKLEEAGFTVKEEDTLGGYLDTVRSQSPRGGKKADKGSQVKISVI
ncbi:MAG: Stk1 family PASTA domain-containing Ser/Thr kinase [Actinomycetaceae bacterium]|nr:Stk1 family PASTA domain-containing Ser/Thr kinase [Actinomycetaceae bacterium]